MTLPVWLEVHVDGAALARALPWRAGDAWAETAEALDALARRAEAEGGRLSFRVKERFARGDRNGFLRGLVARGHEVGWHAHAKGLKGARDAVVAAGGTAAVASPGLVQGGVPRRVALLEAAKSLGATVVTDRVEAPVFAYQGWLAWAPVPGLTSLDVSVSPFDWGVLVRRGRKIVPGTLDPRRLLERIAARERLAVPTGARGFFGATLHDHDVMGPQGADAIEGLATVFGRLGPRLVPSASVAAGWAPPEGPAEGSGRFAALGRRLLRWRLSLERQGAPSQVRRLQVGGRTILARRVGPAAPRAVVVVVHGGPSGVEQGLAPFGLSEAALAEAGLAAWTFARSEGLRPPGSLETVAETRAVLVEALAEGRPVAMLTWSAGIVPALRAALALGDPRVALLVDGEGPADRFSLMPPGGGDGELAKLDPWDDRPWAKREAVELIRAFPGRYVRLQATDDHVHGRMWWHALRMVEAARNGRLNGDGTLLPGRLDAHGARILEWLGEVAS